MKLYESIAAQMFVLGGVFILCAWVVFVITSYSIHYTKLYEAAWAAGLANWRQHRFAEAETYFGIVATAHAADPWTQAAGAYWAARAALHARQPQIV